jgi:hypothetical protein
MSGMQVVRRSRAERLVSAHRTRLATGSGGSSPRRSRVSDSGAGVDAGRGEGAVVSSPQQRAALQSLAYAYGALLRAAHPEYDWVVEVLE